MSSTHSSDPLLSTPSLDEDQLNPADGYFGYRQRPQDLYIEGSITGQPLVQVDEADRPDSPHSVISSAPALSEAEWVSDTDSLHSEGNPLLTNRSPSPDYDSVDPIYAVWRNVVETQSKSGSDSTPIQDTPRPLIDIEVDPQPRHHDQPIVFYPKYYRREERGQKIRDFLRSLPAANIVIAGWVVLALSAAAITWRTGIFSWPPICLTKDFVSRDYQIQSLEYFDLSNTNTQNSGLPKGFSGVMKIFSGPANQQVDLNVSIRSTKSDIRGGKTGAEWRPARLVSCAEATLYFRPGLEISSLQIASNNLDLVLSTDLIVAETTTISLKSGNLVAKNFRTSRETFIDVKSSTVSGTFGIRDLLSIKTQSGSVSVDINPELEFKGRPAPAVLDITSRSGAVKIKYPANETKIPDRVYHSTITSRSGAVSGQILHGKETKIEVKSGNLNARILPFGIDESSSSLITKMQSGFSSIEMLKPDMQHGNPLTRISSLHSARSGNLQLRYPDEWQGSFSGEARSGSLSLRGHDIQITRDKTNGGKKYVEGHKGHGSSKLKFEIRSGNVDATIGH